MVAWAQREPGKVYPAWWENREKLIARRLREMNYAHTLSEADGLPAGMTIKKNTAEFNVWIDGMEAHRQQFTYRVEVAADQLAKWIEAYRQDEETDRIMGISAKGLELLKELAHGGIERKLLGYRAIVADALAKKDPPLVTSVGSVFLITEAGIEVLRGLPEFDMPVLASPPAEEMASPPAPLPRERGEKIDLAAVAADPVDAALDEVSRQYFDELSEHLVRVVMADGIGLDAVVEACGAEIMAMGGTVIKLELKEALLRELYPPLSKLLDGLDAVGAGYAVFGDLQIVVERPLVDANDPIDWEPRQ